MEQVSIDKQLKKQPIASMYDITCIIVAVTIFLSIGPFFAWSSFANGIGVVIFKVIQLLSMALLIVQLKARNISAIAFFCALAVLFMFVFYSFFTGVETGTTYPFIIGNILVYLFYALTVLTEKELLIKSFAILRKMFAVFLAYTLVIYVLLLLNLSIPYQVLQSGEEGRVGQGQFYQNYFGCLLLNQNGQVLYRFTSVFTEPGVVGTFCAFFLAAENCELKSTKNKIFLISGILSLSAAFYVMFVVALALKALRSGGYRSFFGIILIVALYFAFMSIKFTNESLITIQERLTITDGGLVGDNRIKEQADRVYKAFLQGDIRTALLGYGMPNTNLEAWQATASYKEAIYHIGILGYLFMIVWFILTPLICYSTKNKAKNRLMFSYIVIFIISQYQRPYEKSLFLVYILLAGCLCVRQYANDKLNK